MADDTTLPVSIDAKVTGEAATKALASSVAALGDSLQQLAKDAQSAAKAGERIEKTIVGVGKGASAATSQIQNLNKASESLFKINDKRSSGGLAGLAADNAAALQSTKQIGVALKDNRAASKNIAVDAKTASDIERGISSELRTQLNSRREAVRLAREFRTNDKLQTPTGIGPGSAEAVAARMAAAGFREFKDEVDKSTTAQQKHQAALFQTRFALNEISTGTAIAGAALLGMNAATVVTAATYETAFANIQRTTQTTDAQVIGIKNDFLDLASSIPVAFGELAKIGALAGQLNIPTGDIENFTRVTAEFSSSTGVAADSAATAFGRLNTLLPDVKGNYEALGSSILNVGVNSVATEAEIISTTSQIAAAGSQAGLTAKQVIGLAASYASLGVAPEAARGTTVRVFSEIKQAIDQGGDALNEFAALAGQSGEDFKKAWSTDAGAAFIEVLKGLQAEGGNAETTLRGLGITAVRDISALLKLSQNVEIVGENFRYAADGFDQATQLGDAFAITSETLASRVQILQNNIGNFLATIGSSGLAPLKVFVDTLSNMIKWLTEISQNPVAQTLATMAGLFTVLTGGALLFVAAIAKFGASAVAIHTVRAALIDMQAGALSSGVALDGLKAKGISTALALTSLRGVLLSLGAAGAIALAITGVIVAIQAIGEASKSSADKAKDAFGGLGELTSALQADTAEYEKTGERLGTINGTLEKTSTTTADWVQTVNDATHGQVELGDATNVTTTAIDTSTLSIGKNTAAWLANKLANDTSVQAAIKTAAAYNDLAAKQNGIKALDFEGVLAASARNDKAAAVRILDEYEVYLQNLQKSGKLRIGPDSEILNTASSGIEQLRSVIDLTTGALAGAATQGTITDTVMKALGTSGEVVAGELGDAAEGADLLNTALSQIQSAVDNAFASDNLIGDFSSDFLTLVQTVAEGSTSFDTFNASGQANLKNLQETLVSSIASAAVMGVSASESVALVFKQLQAQGVDTARLLASIAKINLPGVNIGDVQGYLTGTKQMSATGTTMAGVYDQIAKAGTDAAAANTKVGSSAAAAAKKVYTLANYASDLGTVFGRSFEIRFGGSQAMDAITSGWTEIADAAEKANKQISDSMIKLQQLASDKSINEYFLNIANQYGDTLRSADISAKLADINGQIADEQTNVNKATAENSKVLSGNSKEAIANRATIEGLVTNYQDYLQALASSGMSQADLANKSAALKQQFVAEAAQLGYNTSEIQNYAVAFDDMTYSIQQLPRNITITADPNPAKVAIAEFMAQNTNGQGASGGIQIPVTATFDGAALAKAARGQALLAQVNQLQKQLDAAYVATKGNSNGATNSLQSRIAALVNQLNSGGYKGGGYTGGGSPSAPAGIVHKKEFVFDAPSTAAIGVNNLQAMMNSRTIPTAPNTSGIMVVELSATDRQLLAAAGNVSLSIGGQVVATASNGANLVSAKRGTA